jgi:RHS repeat-associated protein
VTFSYDPVGNRLSQATHAGTMAYAYDAADRLTILTPAGQAAALFTYDDNGNQLTAGPDTYAWDAADRLIGANVGGVGESYTYAGDGRRLRVTSGAETLTWFWDIAHSLPMLAMERDETGAVVRRSTYGLSRISTMVSSEVAYNHADGLGSAVDLTDPSGDPLAWREYGPFAAVHTSGMTAGASDLPFGFTGEFTDSTGLLHLRARQYDPATGRFLSTDPLTSSLADPYVGTYVYVRNMPTAYRDPSGRCLGPLIFLAPWCVSAAVGAAGYIAGTLATNVTNNLANHRDPLHNIHMGFDPRDLIVSGIAGAAGYPLGGLGVASTSVAAGVTRVLAGAAMGCASTFAAQVNGGRSKNFVETGIGCVAGGVAAAPRISSNVLSFTYGLVVSTA